MGFLTTMGLAWNPSLGYKLTICYPPQHGGVYTQYPRGPASSTSSTAKASVAAGAGGIVGSVSLDSTAGSTTSLADRPQGVWNGIGFCFVVS